MVVIDYTWNYTSAEQVLFRPDGIFMIILLACSLL
jgi:hypothetical protein